MLKTVLLTGTLVLVALPAAADVCVWSPSGGRGGGEAFAEGNDHHGILRRLRRQDRDRNICP